MKKLFSIGLVCAVVLSFMNVVSMAVTTDEQRSVPFLGVIVDGTTETLEFPADERGGVTLSGNGGWNTWVVYWNDAVATFTPAAGETVFLLYDMTVPEDTVVQFSIDKWENPIFKELADPSAAESGPYPISAGTYSGTLELDYSKIGDNGRLGILGYGIEIRTCMLVCAANTPTTSETTSSTATAEETTTSKSEATGKTATESTTETVAETVAETTTEIPTKAASEVTAETSFEKTTKTTTATASETTAEVTTTTTTETTTKRATETAVETTGKITTETDIEVTTETAAEARVETTTEFTKEPTKTVTQSSGTRAIYKGDANADGAINMKDVLILRKRLADMDVSPDLAASDVNSDGLVNMKDVLMIRQYLAGIITSFGGDEPEPTTTIAPPTTQTTTQTTSDSPVSPRELNLIGVITNGSNEADGAEIRDEGNGFVISQSNAWNVWVLYFDEAAVDFRAAEGEQVFLEFDMTINGSAHLNVNGWNHSIAAAIADACGKDTTPAEDNTPMLIQGTYTGKIPFDPSWIGENGRLGIVGSGAVIRTFKLVSEKAEDNPTASTTEKTNTPTESVSDKTTQPTTTDIPYFSYETAQKFGSLGVWWWNANQITSESACTERLDFLQQNHVTEIYLCVVDQTDTQIAAFIKNAASRGMRVAWLSGDVSWLDEDNTGFDEVFARFKAYQDKAAENEKFYGIHLDVEPHQRTNPDWQGYADFVVRAGKEAHAFGTVIEWDIPFWLDDTLVTVDGKSQKLLTVLAENADTLALMSYRDTAAAMLGTAMQEIPLGAEYGCKIILGAETYSLEGPAVSFMEEGKAIMYAELESVLSALVGENLPGGYGCAIHYVDTWMNLKN